jgi:membrane protein implicated in regulation of membrane protease activity
MNIKLKVGLEVAGGLTAMVVIAVGVKAILEALTEAYGFSAVLNGIAFSAVSVAAYVAASLLYDIRVNQLKYKAKLEEMTKK